MESNWGDLGGLSEQEEHRETSNSPTLPTAQVGKLKSKSGEVPAKATVEVGAVEAVQTAGPQHPQWGSAADLFFFRTGAPVLATFQPFCPPVFPGALGPQEVMWKWCEDNVRSPTGYHPKGVP